MIPLTHNSSTKENKAAPVSKKPSSLSKVQSSSTKMRRKSWMLKRQNCLKSKTTNNGKYKTLLLLKKFTKWEITLTKLKCTCCRKEHNRFKNFWMSRNISSNSFLMKLGEQLCLIICQVEITSWTSENNTQIICTKTWLNGPNLFSFTMMLIIHEN